MSSRISTPRFLSLCMLTLSLITCGEMKDALREFFRDNGRLLLVNPFPESLPMGVIVRPEQGELREINRRCFEDLQVAAMSQPYDFIAEKTDKKRGISAHFLTRLGNMDLASSQAVSIEVVDGKKTHMDESTFRSIIEDPNFPTECTQDIDDKRNYIVHEIITGKLQFTFWRNVAGKWEVNPIPPVNALEQTGPLSGLWTTTQEGGIQMKEQRVLAVRARPWKRGSRGEFGKRMSLLEFNRVWRLDWKLGEQD